MSNQEEILKDEIEQSRKQLKEKEALLARLQHDATVERLRVYRPYAQQAHDLFCTWNHTDGCGWGYECVKDEDATWSNYTHNRWLLKIEKIFKETKITEDRLDEILTTLKDLDITEDGKKAGDYDGPVSWKFIQKELQKL